MSDPAPDTILLDLFRTNQIRERLLAAALEDVELHPQDYPFFVLIGAEGPLTPTALAARMAMPLSTVLFRAGKLERRGHVERAPNPDDGRSYLLRLSEEAVPTIYVSHHAAEVKRIATTIVRIEEGRVIGIGGAELLDAADADALD